MATRDGVDWNEEVLKERAKIHAQRNPNPPLTGWRRTLVIVLVTVGLLLSCMAWRILLGW